LPSYCCYHRAEMECVESYWRAFDSTHSISHSRGTRCNWSRILRFHRAISCQSSLSDANSDELILTGMCTKSNSSKRSGRTEISDLGASQFLAYKTWS
jgi:hypothetical protein